MAVNPQTPARRAASRRWRAKNPGQSLKWRTANPERARELDAQTRAARAARVRSRLDALKDKACADCGVKYPPCVMEFDHVRGVKRYCIGTKTIGRPDLGDEIAKCELRCANCHRLRHARERGEDV
jgi:hypothetical protein